MYNINVKDKKRKNLSKNKQSQSKSKNVKEKKTMAKKITARENYIAIAEFVRANGGDEAWAEFLDAQVTKLDAKAEKAKAKRAEKAAEPDPFIEAIAGAIGDEPITADEIVAKLGIEDLTKNKVTARIGKIEGVEKVDIKVENAEGKTVKRVAYVKA